jgi:HSP20 family protein
MSNRTQVTERSDQPLARQTISNTSRTEAVVPPVDIYEDSHGITLWADLPGVSREQLDVRFEDGSLTIEGQVAVQTPEGLRVTHAELLQPRFARAFSLSADFDPTRIDANLSNGVLKLSIPRREEARPRRIEVRAG